jgi:protein TonB
VPPFDAATGSGPKPPQDFHSPWGDPSKDKRKGLWLVLFVLVLLGHGLLLVGAKKIPEKKKQTRVEMALVTPPPPPPPPPEVVEEKPQPKKKKKPKPKPKKPPPPPPSNTEPPPEPQKAPPPIVTGISMASTVKSSGFNIRVGNTTYGDMNKEDFVDPSKVKGYRGGQKGWQPVRAGKLSRQAKVRKEVKPKYPLQAVEAEIEGTVVLRIEVTKKGAVRKAKLIRGLGFGLDQAAMAAIKNFVFYPALVDDEKVDSIINYRMTFDLVD